MKSGILGYCFGSHAPGRNVAPGVEPYLAAHHMLLAHARAQDRLGFRHFFCVLLPDDVFFFFPLVSTDSWGISLFTRKRIVCKAGSFPGRAYLCTLFWIARSSTKLFQTQVVDFRTLHTGHCLNDHRRSCRRVFLLKPISWPFIKGSGAGWNLLSPSQEIYRRMKPKDGRRRVDLGPSTPVKMSKALWKDSLMGHPPKIVALRPLL